MQHYEAKNQLYRYSAMFFISFFLELMDLWTLTDYNSTIVPPLCTAEHE